MKMIFGPGSPHRRSFWMIVLSVSGIMFQKHSIHRYFIASALLSSPTISNSKPIFWPISKLLQRQKRQGQLPVAWGIRDILLQRRGGSSNLIEQCSSQAPTFLSRGDAVEIDVEQIVHETKTSILGGMVCQKFAGSISYWDASFHPREFRVVFILGGPGAGKGTQSSLLAQNYPCVHLSAGELLREAASENSTSPHQQLISDCLVLGKIVPVEISLSLLQGAMEEASRTRGKSLIFLIDGFPRNYDNLQGWIQCMSLPQIASVWGVLYYSCPLRELERRILERASQGSGRSDDNIQSAQKRFKTFEQQTVPVVRTLQRVQDLQLQACGKNNEGVESVNPLTLQVATIAGDQTLDNVWQDTQKIMNGWIANDVWSANARLLQAIQERNASAYHDLAVYCDENDDESRKLEVMNRYEADTSGWDISNPHMEFETGTKVIVSYDRTVHARTEDNGMTTVKFRERRVWSHEGTKGWVNIYFYRTPLSN